MATARLLIVDDQPATLKLISRILSAKYEVLSASTPHKALEVIRTEPKVDLVLSDIEMSEMRGPDLIRRVRQISPLTGCLLMSGNAEAAIEVPTDTQFLQKPFSADELFAKVESVLAGSGKLRSDLANKMEKATVLLDKAVRLKRKLIETIDRSVEIRNCSLEIRRLPPALDNPEQGLDTIICASCAAELPVNAPCCNHCNKPVGLHAIVRDGRGKFGIAVHGKIRLHGLTFEKARDLIAILNSIGS